MNVLNEKKRVLVAMSGGVDSSVAAALLVQQGYEVIGATMQVWDYNNCEIEEGHGTCCSSTDVDDARAVADRLNIPFYVLNCEAKFKEAVIDPFIQSYLQGKTPLPCVDCNTYLKFDHLIQKMKELECDYLATGHYAKLVLSSSGKPMVAASDDTWKDQTYFLFTIQPELIPKLLFPIGHLQKSQVREIAEASGLVVARKKDSTGICFVGGMGYANFVDQQIDEGVRKQQMGQLRRWPTGEILGQHPGIHHFTIGQGKGFGLTHHEKLFVIKIDATTKEVWLGEETYLYAKSVEVIQPRWFDELQANQSLKVKIRYHHAGCEARFVTQDGRYYLEFAEPQRAITSGQAAVFYRGQELLGGAWIK